MIPDQLCSRKALEKYPEEGGQLKDGVEIAKMMKIGLDDAYGPYWHVTVGKDFGCYAVHEKQRFTYFYIGPFAFMVYKGGC